MNKVESQALVKATFSKGWDALVSGKANSVTWVPSGDGSIKFEMMSSQNELKKK